MVAERAAQLGHSTLVSVVDKVASQAIRTEGRVVESLAELCLVLGVARKVAQLMGPMCELTFVTIVASAIFYEGTAEFGLVA